MGSWDSGPHVCLAQPCSVSEIIPCIEGVFSMGTFSWEAEEESKWEWFSSGRVRGTSCLGKEVCLTPPPMHYIWHSFCPLYPPFTHSPASALVEAFQSFTCDAAHTACTSVSISCLPVHVSGWELTSVCRMSFSSHSLCPIKTPMPKWCLNYLLENQLSPNFSLGRLNDDTITNGCPLG